MDNFFGGLLVGVLVTLLVFGILFGDHPVIDPDEYIYQSGAVSRAFVPVELSTCIAPIPAGFDLAVILAQDRTGNWITGTFSTEGLCVGPESSSQYFVVLSGNIVLGVAHQSWFAGLPGMEAYARQ